MTTSTAAQSPAEPTPAETTWTFCGHWENHELVIEFAVLGEQPDTRPDTGHWDEGLWSDSGTAVTQDDALDALALAYDAAGWRWAGPDEETP